MIHYYVNFIRNCFPNQIAIVRLFSTRMSTASFLLFRDLENEEYFFLSYKVKQRKEPVSHQTHHGSSPRSLAHRWISRLFRNRLAALS